MGAYLSAPVTDKVSSNEKDEHLGLSYGASSMQGWRNSQEDAHNCILDFDPETSTSLFAVYDGHGGSEVATYCALNLPNFIKTLDLYKAGDLAKALEEGYIDFDQLLTKEDVINVLKIISGRKNQDDKEDDDPSEMADLHEEATMSIEELILKYSCRTSRSEQQEESEDGENSTEKPGSSRSVSVGDVLLKLYRSSRKKTVTDKEEDEDGIPAKNESLPPTDATSEPSEEPSSKASDNELSTNGEGINGTGESTKAPFVSSKGKGKGKGLSNFIRKKERSAEEIEREKREAEKLARAAERKQNLRKRSEEDLYKDLTATEVEDENDDDPEEDEDFVGEDSSASDVPEEEDEDEDEEDEEEDDDDEEGAEDEEDDTAAREVVNRFAQSMKEEPGSDSGCTAVVALIRRNKLYVANAGDSRCVLSRRGQAVSLTSDHKPEDEPERSRIEKAGGAVTADGRVNGGLNLSRALGDHAYKQNKELGPREQMITALPDVQTIDLEAGDEFLVLACDGIWNSKTNQEVVDFVLARMHLEPTKLSDICEELFDECLAPNTLGDGTGCDNMTAIIVRLDKYIGAESNGDSKGTVGDVSSGPVKRPLSPDFPSNSSSTDEPSTTDSRAVGEAESREKRLKIDETEESEQRQT